MPTVKQIVEFYLKQNDFEGLAGEDCCCQLSDLMPCASLESGIDVGRCEAGHKVKCDPQTCTADGDCDFHIKPGKRD